MRFQGLDLDLLVALDALLTQRNLTAAARSVNLSQPAMSAALSRLRTYFGDDILALQGRRLAPTAKGQALTAPTREALLKSRLCSPRGMISTPQRRNADFALCSRTS